MGCKVTKSQSLWKTILFLLNTKSQFFCLENWLVKQHCYEVDGRISKSTLAQWPFTTFTTDFGDFTFDQSYIANWTYGQVTMAAIVSLRTTGKVGKTKVSRKLLCLHFNPIPFDIVWKWNLSISLLLFSYTCSQAVIN